MKQLLLMSILILFVLTGCEKEDPIADAPKAFAGADLYVVLPANSATLNGRVRDAASAIVHQSWKKISGPASFVIERPELLQTNVINLEKGTYEYELTVRDKGGLRGMDTVMVDVYDPRIEGSNEFIFRNLEWIFSWNASIEVKNINGYATPLKVFIQRDFDAAWKEVNNSDNSTYEYFIETRPGGAGMYNPGSLYIFYYGTRTDDTPQVKIQF